MLAFMILAQAVAGEVSKLPVAQPLPDNKPCVFPAEAERQGVAGVVSFVAQVAADVGYFAQAHMIAAFRRFAGATPSRFARGR